MIPSSARDFLMMQFKFKAIESIRTILEKTGIHSRKLAIETIEFPFKLTTQMEDELD